MADNTKLIIENALSGWIDGEVIARRDFESGTRIVVTQTEGGTYSMFRAFIIGGRAEVSADVQERTLGDVVAKLLAIIPEGLF